MENTTNAPEKKKKVLSLIQPTATPHIGNYLGALKNWKQMSQEYECVFGVADLHALTVRPEPALLRRQSLETLALLLAISLFAVNDFKTFTGYYTCSLLFLFSLLFVLNKNHSSTIRFIVFGILAAIGFYGKPLILLSFLIAFPGILLVEKDLTFVKTGKLFSIALFSFIFIISPWQI